MIDKITLLELSAKREDRTYRLYIPQGSPIGEAYDAVHEFLESILTLAQEAAQKAKPKDITEG